MNSISNRILSAVLRGAAAVVLVSAVSSPAVAGTDSLRWQFPENAIYTYHIDQEMKSVTGGKSGDEEMKQEMSMGMSGTVTITGDGEKGKLRVELSPKFAKIGDQDVDPAQIGAAERTVEAAMGTDGVVIDDDPVRRQTLQQLMNYIFPLPDRPFKKGKPVTREITMALPGVSPVRGNATYKITKTGRQDEFECVYYHVSMKMKSYKPDAKETPPPEGVRAMDIIKALGLDGNLNMGGEFDCVFIPERGMFMSVDGVVKIGMKVDGSAEKKGVKISMEQEHNISVGLVSAEY